jgi:hypothetical protein
MRDADAMQGLYRVAEHSARLPRGSLLARELVTDVIEDMLLGDAKCDATAKLGPQVERVVQRRGIRLHRGSRPGRRPSQRPEFVPLDKVPASALVASPQQADEDGEQLADDNTALALRIRERARDDEPVQLLLALYDRDVLLRRDLLDAGMTAWEYRTARERLTQYAALVLADDAPLSVSTTPQEPARVVLPATLPAGAPGRTLPARQSLPGRVRRSRRA